jgi:crotonobetainyl-CoA:carnitine CoA-transferase CaiB-like acyl-CoA transferase
VVVNNWRIGVLDRLGFGYDDLKQHRPDIIVVNATTFGPRGPWASKPGRDTLGQAAGGLMYVNGPDDGTPRAVGALVADQTAGMVEALAILAALQYRTRTGRGQIVDTSLYGTVIAMQAWEITQRSMANETIGRHRAHCFALRGAWGAFKTSDGSICLAGVHPRIFPAFCRALGIEEHAFTYDSIDAMYQRADQLESLLDRVFPTRTTREWLEALEPLDILAAPVQSYDEIIESEQARVNGYIVPLEHPILGTLQVVGVPISMSEADIRPRGAPPEVGQHTEEVLLSLGFSWEEMEYLRTRAVI